MTARIYGTATTYQSGSAATLTPDGLLAWRDKLVADSLKVPDQSEVEFYNDYFKQMQRDEANHEGHH